MNIKKELAYYLSTNFSGDLCSRSFEIKNVKKREIKVLFEEFINMPQSLFFFNYLNTQFFGKKTLSDQVALSYTKNKGRFASIPMDRSYAEITPLMFLGIVFNKQFVKNGVKISYHPLSLEEKVFLFDKIKYDDVDIYHPYIRLDRNKNELIATQEDWNKYISNIETLDADEECIRDYTLRFLSNFDLNAKRIYDPACSSGKFLYEIKKMCPFVYTIGQDSNMKMIRHAANYIDQTILADVYDKRLTDNTADFIFIRFLNSSVVHSNIAYDLFLKIIRCCKVGGYIILLGHTPILISKAFMLSAGLSIESHIAYCKKHNSIFQYYILKKIQ
jgi:isonocardicin synthase